MGDPNSLLSLWEATTRTCFPGVSPKSVEYVIRRVSREGDTFLTTVLPQLAKALVPVFRGERYIVPKGYRLFRDHCPLFLSELFSVILTEDGFLSTNLSERYLATCVQQINQICMFAYKLEVPHTDEQERKAIAAWKQANDKCNSLSYDYFSSLRVVQQARILVRRLLAGVSPLDIVPRHSNGALAEGHSMRNSTRWIRVPAWTKKLDNVYPMSQYWYINDDHLVEEHDHIDHDPSSIARIAFVPKDSRGPRTICCAPSGPQFIQQGLMVKLYEVIERSNIRDISFVGMPERKIHVGTFIPLRDQSIMQQLAQAGSLGGHLSTIDLQAASDSVSWNLVRALFPMSWVDAFQAVRADFATFPDGSVEPMHMAFPMGDSLCFPVESLVFWAISKAAGVPHSDVWAYGDDLIVETECYDSVVTALRHCGFTVNSAKSFPVGPFKESCGADYLFGIDVRPLMIRRIPTGRLSSRTATSWMSAIGFINQFEQRYPNLACVKAPRDVLDEIHILPYSCLSNLGYNARESRNVLFCKHRWNNDYQRDEYHIPMLVAKTLNTLDGWAGVRKYLLLPSKVDSSRIKGDAQLRWAWNPIV